MMVRTPLPELSQPARTTDRHRAFESRRCPGRALRANDRIAASAGSLTDSIILAMPDYLRIAAPKECFAFSTPP